MVAPTADRPSPALDHADVPGRSRHGDAVGREPRTRDDVLPPARGRAAGRARLAGAPRGHLDPAEERPQGHVPDRGAAPRPIRDRPARRCTTRTRSAWRRPRRRRGPRPSWSCYPVVEDIDARGLVSQGAGSGEAAAQASAPRRGRVLHDARVHHGRRPAPDPLAERGSHGNPHDPSGRIHAAIVRDHPARHAQLGARARRDRPASRRPSRWWHRSDGRSRVRASPCAWGRSTWRRGRSRRTSCSTCSPASGRRGRRGS